VDIAVHHNVLGVEEYLTQHKKNSNIGVEKLD